MIKAYIPGRKYVAVSITGTYCELMCPHCRGRYLKGMIKASKPDELEAVLKALYAGGVRGFLISGGFTRDGYLMISEDHIRIIKNFIRNHEAVFSIHLGLAPPQLLDSVWSAGIDVIDFEVPPSNDYVRVCRGLKGKGVRDYVNYIESVINDYGRNFIAPHLILNSKYASSNDELEVIKALSRVNPYIVVVLIEIGSSFNRVRIEDSLARIRASFTNVSLGCMRPRDAKLVEGEWIRSGLIDRVAVPRREVIKKFNLRIINACCSLKEKYERMFTS